MSADLESQTWKEYFKHVIAPIIPYASVSIDITLKDYLYASTTPITSAVQEVIRSSQDSPSRIYPSWCQGCSIRNYLENSACSGVGSKAEWAIIKQWAQSWITPSLSVPFSTQKNMLDVEVGNDIKNEQNVEQSISPIKNSNTSSIVSEDINSKQGVSTTSCVNTTNIPSLPSFLCPSCAPLSNAMAQTPTNTINHPNTRTNTHTTNENSSKKTIPSNLPSSPPVNCLPPPPTHTYNTIVTLSVRTALDSYLTVMNFPRGSFVLLSSMNIPDMCKVFAEHGLIPLPVDIDLNTCGVSLTALQAKLTQYGVIPHSNPPPPPAFKELCTPPLPPSIHLPPPAGSPGISCVLIAHIYGKKNDLSPLAKYCHSVGIPLIEDCAESYTDTVDKGSIESDISLFSFGSIKHGTAFGGGVCRIRDNSVFWNMRLTLDILPKQTNAQFAKKLLKMVPAALALNNSSLGGAVVRVSRLLNIDYKELVVSMLRGFPGDLIVSLRHGPSPALLKLLLHRLTTETNDRMLYAARIGNIGQNALLQLEADVLLIGSHADTNHFWLFPVLFPRPQHNYPALLREGVDVYQGATQLKAVPIPSFLISHENKALTHTGIPNTDLLMKHILYLPVSRNLGQNDVLRMAMAVVRAVGTKKENKHLGEFYVEGLLPVKTNNSLQSLL